MPLEGRDISTGLVLKSVFLFDLGQCCQNLRIVLLCLIKVLLYKLMVNGFAGVTN